MDDNCSVKADNLKSLLNTLCIFDDEQATVYLACSGAIFLTSAAIELYLFRQSQHKLKKVLTQCPSATYEQTYCILFYIQLRVMQAFLLAMFFIQLMPVFYLALGANYTQLFFSRSQVSCNVEHWYQRSALQYVNISVYTGIELLCQATILAQIFEWVAMIMLILTQKDKSLGEILYDHNYEDMSERLTLQQLKTSQRVSRRRELFLKSVFQIVAIVCTAILFFFQFCIDFFGRFYLGYLVYILILYLGLCLSFATIFHLMNKYHHYEFHKNRKPMLLFMLAVTASLLTNGVVVYIDSHTINFDDLDSYVSACYNPESQQNSIIIQISVLFIPLSNLQFIAFATSIIVYKKTDDILQGVSKLDYLLKVSVFQIYKNSEPDACSAVTSSDDGALSNDGGVTSATSEQLNFGLQESCHFSID